MKKYTVIFLLAFFLCGCGRNAPETTAPSEIFEENVPEVTTPVILSEHEVQQLFLKYAKSEWIIMDCVPVTDSQYGILGVVQYTTEDYDGCRFDFLHQDGPKTVGVGALPAGEDRLIYAGEDTITCELLRENGEIYICSISYYEHGTEEGFQVSG